jgi:hypothetical protein
MTIMSIILNLFSAILDLFNPANTQGYGNTSSSGITYGLLFILIFFVIAVALSVHKRRKRERKYFSAEIKRATLEKQRHKCAYCRGNSDILDFDHKDGNRSNNKMSNCLVLCPNCHAKKSRGLIKVRKESKGSIKVIVFLFFFLVFVSLFFFNWT